jgi:hypothetical protein
MVKFEYQKHWSKFLSGKVAINCQNEDDSDAFITMCARENQKTNSSNWHIFGNNTAYIYNQMSHKVCIHSINLLKEYLQVVFEKDMLNESHIDIDDEDFMIDPKEHFNNQEIYTTITLPNYKQESNCIVDSPNNLILLIDIEFESIYQDLDSKIRKSFFNNLKQHLIDSIIKEPKINKLNDINNIRVIEANNIEYFYNTTI